MILPVQAQVKYIFSNADRHFTTCEDVKVF